MALAIKVIKVFNCNQINFNHLWLFMMILIVIIEQVFINFILINCFLNKGLMATIFLRLMIKSIEKDYFNRNFMLQFYYFDYYFEAFQANIALFKFKLIINR